MAVEKVKQEGIKCMMVIVADDVALPVGKGITGGRGIAGTILVHKIAGASAALGASLEDVYNITYSAISRIGFVQNFDQKSNRHLNQIRITWSCFKCMHCSRN